MFERVIDDDASKINKPQDVKRVVFCSGKLYYELNQQRLNDNNRDVAIVRLEQVRYRSACVLPALRFLNIVFHGVVVVVLSQIAPFPHDAVAAVLKKYPNAEITWAQEEPRNMGAWSFVAPRFVTCNAKLAHRAAFTPRYFGRLGSASPAAGAKKISDLEQQKLIKEALTV